MSCPNSVPGPVSGCFAVRMKVLAGTKRHSGCNPNVGLTYLQLKGNQHCDQPFYLILRSSYYKTYKKCIQQR
jgi:hypothetical protein